MPALDPQAAALRQRRVVERLEEAGGKRQSFNLPADVRDILDGMASAGDTTATAALIHTLRQVAQANPKIAAAAREAKARRETAA